MRIGIALRERLSFPLMLLGTIAGVYVLVMVGATLSVSESLAACHAWPTCDGRWLVPLEDPAAIAWGHRVIALLVGGLLLVTTVLGWRVTQQRRVKVGLVVAAILYPAQMGIGAITALAGPSAVISMVHLLTAMAIFGTLVVTLAWSLEWRYPSEDDSVEPATEETVNEAPSHTAPLPPSWRQTVMAYIRLTKPRLMWLLCLVAAAGMALAAGPSLRVQTVIATLGGGVLAIGASGTFNHVLERDIDRQMERTAERPLVTDIVPVRNALAFGVLLAAAAIATFLFFVNVLTAALGLAAIIFYSVIYTLLLKPHTVQNTVIGGAAGALPALIGWAAVTGRIAWPGLVLALVIFCWTPAHFYNLALAYKEDYARGGFPMLPVVHGDRLTRKHILLYAGLTMLMAAALAAVSTLSLLFSLTAILGGVGFLVMIYRLHQKRTSTAALHTFHASNGYLGLLLVVIVVDALVI